MTDKKSYWPLALVITFVVFISWLVIFIVFSSRQRMDLVSADYYEQGVDYQKQIDRRARTMASSNPMAITYHADAETIVLSCSPEHIPTHGRLTLYRPSNANLDRTFPLDLAEDGTQALPASDFPGGLWKARIEWTYDGQEFYSEEDLVLPAQTGVVE